VFFHLQRDGFRCRRPLAASPLHGGGEPTTSQAHGGRPNRQSRFQNPHSDAFQPDAGIGISRSQSSPAHRRDAAQRAPGVMQDAAGRIENQKAQPLGTCA
jgi:hypothetical protein